jgi:ferredoxin-thioredoxin reductase catalytic subunit
VLEFCEKYEGRYKLIFVLKKKYLIDIRRDKESYCGLYFAKEIKNNFIV